MAQVEKVQYTTLLAFHVIFLRLVTATAIYQAKRALTTITCRIRE